MSDTSEITNGCLIHYDSSHIQTRRDFMGICPVNEACFEDKPKEKPNQECMAKILRIMETLTDHAKTQWKLAALQAKEKGLDIPNEPKEYPLELANSAVVSLIYGTFAESMVRNSLDYLVGLGYLKRWQERKNSTPIYWLQLPYIQTLLEQQAKARLSGCDFKPPHMQGAISNPKPVKSKGKRGKSNPDPAISQGAGFESTDNNKGNTDNTSFDTDNTEDSVGSGEPDAAPASITDLQSWRTESEKRRAIQAVRPSQEEVQHAFEAEETIPRGLPRITGEQLAARVVAQQQQGGNDGQRLAPSQQTTSPVLAGDGPAQLPLGRVAPATLSEPGASGAGGKRTPTPPNKPRGTGKPTHVERPQLTLQGSQVKEWIELIQATTITGAWANIRACNALGENAQVTFASLKATVEHLEALKWVREHDYAIDVQVLADGESRLNFEKNWPLVRRKLGQSAPSGNEPETVGGYIVYRGA